METIGTRKGGGGGLFRVIKLATIHAGKYNNDRYNENDNIL